MSQLPSFFRTHQPKRFNYTPFYYDEQKEDLEQRTRQIKQDMGHEKGEVYVPKIRKGQMGNFYRRKRKQIERRSNIRLFIVILFLALAAWLLFFR
ncbi:MAG: hypothetical protein U9N53_15805 [Bacteroidota bacterium]|nr:hypothetical protein [Bacteroidota bacterium]